MSCLLTIDTHHALHIAVRESFPLCTHYSAYSLKDGIKLFGRHRPEIVLFNMHSTGTHFPDGVLPFVNSFLKTSLFIIHKPQHIHRICDLALLGAAYFFPLPVDMPKLKEAVLKVSCNQQEYVSEHQENSMLIKEFAGISKMAEEVRLRTARYAPLQDAVLITGETGTGKEIVASLLHRLSRESRPFITVNCCALSSHIAESELFGHQRGSFTGAHQDRKGYLEEAHQGTILLDEIGDMDLSLQPKLLRVLETQSVMRVGSSRSIPIDTRIIAATNQELGALMDSQIFRADLFYRIHTLHIHIPPLRERAEDIPVLIRHLSDAEPPLIFTDQAMSSLMAYPWPGNVRELRHTLTRIRVISQHTDSVTRVTKAHVQEALSHDTSALAALREEPAL